MKIGIRLNSKKTTALFTAFWVSACCTTGEEVSTQKSDLAAIEIQQGPILNLQKIKSSEKADMKRWINESLGILHSDSFKQNLISLSSTYQNAWLSDSNGSRTSMQIIDILQTVDPAIQELNWTPTTVILEGYAKPAETGTGYDRSGRNEYAGVGPEGRTPTLNLGRVHLDRFVNGSIVEKSCAVNSLTHEFTHMLSDKSDSLSWVVVDTVTDSTSNTGRPLGMFGASYLVGTVAQCTYLQNEGRIDSDDLESCVRTFGDPRLKYPFQSFACNDFEANQDIIPSNRDEQPPEYADGITP